MSFPEYTSADIYLSIFSCKFWFHSQVLPLTSTDTVLCQVSKRSFTYNSQMKGVLFHITHA